jgi:oligogalacturonide lyase
MDMETLESKIIYEPGPAWWVNKTFGVTPDCTHVAQVQLHKDDLVSRRKSSDMAAQWAKKPRCRIVVVDVASAASTVVFDDRLWAPIRR